MPLNLNKLSALAVNKTNKPGYYGDGGGLWLQVAKSGSKGWIFRFSPPSLRFCAAWRKGRASLTVLSQGAQRQQRR